MPQIVVPKYGAANLTVWLLNHGIDSMPELSLAQFVNDYTPTWETVIADFVEASYDGYNEELVQPDQWTVSLGADPPALATYNTEFSWTSGSDTGTVYGYYVYRVADGLVVWAQRFDTPYALEDGLEIKIRPKLSLWSRCIPECSESEGG